MLQPILEIPDYLDRSALLQFLVSRINDLLQADGCSIFLRETHTNRYVLSESTVLSEFIGVDAIDLDERKKQLLDKGELYIGLTFCALVDGTILNIPDVRKDLRWQGHSLNPDTLHCELPGSLRSLVLVLLHQDRAYI